jgi:hypothetical protein
MKTPTDRAADAIEAAEIMFAEETGTTLDLSPAAKVALIVKIAAAIQSAVAEETQRLSWVLWILALTWGYLGRCVEISLSKLGAAPHPFRGCIAPTKALHLGWRIVLRLVGPKSDPNRGCGGGAVHEAWSARHQQYERH